MAKQKTKYHYNHIWAENIKELVDCANKWADRGFRLSHVVRGAGQGDHSTYWQGIIEKVVDVDESEPVH